MTNTVRETKRADELKTGDWLAAEQIPGDGDRPTEVLNIYPFTDGDGPAVLLVYRDGDGRPQSMPADAHQPYELATQEELNAGREAAERVQRFADARALLDFLEANPALPVPRFYFQESPDPHGDVWKSGAEGLATVTRWAEIMGVKVEELDERHSASRRFGTAEYCVIAWHKDGRPAESVAEDAEPEAER